MNRTRGANWPTNQMQMSEMSLKECRRVAACVGHLPALRRPMLGRFRAPVLVFLLVSVSTALCFARCGEDSFPPLRGASDEFRLLRMHTGVQPRLRLLAALRKQSRDHKASMLSAAAADGAELLLRLNGGGGPRDDSPAEGEGQGQDSTDDRRVGLDQNAGDVEATKTFLLSDSGTDPTPAPPSFFGPLSIGERAVLEGLRNLSLDRQGSTLGKLAAETPDTLRRLRELGKVEEEEWEKWEREMESQMHKKFSGAGEGVAEGSEEGDEKGDAEGDADNSSPALGTAVDKGLGDDDQSLKRDGGGNDDHGVASAGDDIPRGHLRHLAKEKNEKIPVMTRRLDDELAGSSNGSRGADGDKGGAVGEQIEGPEEVRRGQSEREVDVGWLPAGWYAKRVNNRIQYCNDFLRRVQVWCFFADRPLLSLVQVRRGEGAMRDEARGTRHEAPEARAETPPALLAAPDLLSTRVLPTVFQARG